MYSVHRVKIAAVFKPLLLYFFFPVSLLYLRYVFKNSTPTNPPPTESKRPADFRLSLHKGFGHVVHARSLLGAEKEVGPRPARLYAFLILTVRAELGGIPRGWRDVRWHSRDCVAVCFPCRGKSRRGRC